MPQGLSLHIGLNGVDATKYNGWAGTLAGCVNDANAMQAIAQSQGFVGKQLIDGNATADNILYEIGRAAHVLTEGDSFLVSYSGHGGQVPDANGDEDDGLDETWVAYDRMIVDDELYGLWSQFAAGVSIQVYSDSCHSGTVLRDLILPNGMFHAPDAGGAPTNTLLPMTRNFAPLGRFNTVYRTAAGDAQSPSAPKLPGRSIPPALALQLYAANRSFYETRQFTNKRSIIEARVVLISGCQDNQTSQDGQTNGLFTEKLLAVWNNGSFAGTLAQFARAITALMPETQTPNYEVLGAENATFDAARPLTILGGNSATPVPEPSGGPVPPSVSGPETCDRDGTDVPTFSVQVGSNAYYIFEIANAPDALTLADRTNGTDFYGSWGDPDAPARMTSPSYRLPQEAWDALKFNNVLYYRVGSTSSNSGWDDYLTSTTDVEAAQAPSIRITSSEKAGPPPSTDALIGTY